MLWRVEAQVQELQEKQETIERSITETLEKLRTLEEETAQEEKKALALSAEVMPIAIHLHFNCIHISAGSYQWA